MDSMMGEFYRDLEYPVGVQRQQAMLVLPNQINSTKLNIYTQIPTWVFLWVENSPSCRSLLVGDS